MMSSTACCFLSLTSHQYCRATSTSAFHAVQSTHNGHNFRHSDGASSFQRRYNHMRRSRSSSYWSLQTQLDDDNDNTPSRTRRRRNRARDTNLNNDQDDSIDTITSILFQPVSIPNARQSVPAIYPLALIATLVVLPPITSVLVAIFFGFYFALLLPILDDESDDIISLDETDDDEQEYDEINRSVAALATAYLGAVASAALLSPQGLIASSENEGGLLSLSSVPYLFASLLVGLGGLVLVSGVNETAEDERRLEREEIDALPERKERSVMKQWDDELKEKDDGF